MEPANQLDNNNLFEDEDSDEEAPDLIELCNDAENDGEDPSEVQTPLTSNDDETDQRACPVTILSGFLGSGKTTLIQYILKNPDHGKKIAVIENEFGEGLAIESLIARDGIDPGSGSLQDLIELPNGCVCCTVKDSLVETLELLLTKRSDLDYILIEASGMADPGPIASVFWLDEALESRLKLDGIVTLVDGKHILGQLAETEEAARQIAYADRIVLNKVDLLSENPQPNRSSTAPPSLVEVEQTLRAIHPTAPILKTSFSKIPDLDWILDADCFSGFDHLEKVQTGFDEVDHNNNHDHHHDHHHDGGDCPECCHGEQPNDGESHDHHHEHIHDHQREDHQHHEHKHKHTASITTISLDYQGSVDVQKLNAWMADILWPNQDETDTVLTAMLRQQEQDGPQSTEAASAVDPNVVYSASGGHASRTSSQQQQQIFRIKGIVSIVSSEDYELEAVDEKAIASGLDPRRFIVQAVHDLWDIQPVTSLDLFWESEESRSGKIVVIGKFLDEKRLRDGFQKCFV